MMMNYHFNLRCLLQTYKFNQDVFYKQTSQLHYVIKELENAIDISNIEIINYLAVNDKLNEIPLEVISLSKLKERMQ